MRYNIKITSLRFGKIEGTIHKLGMSYEAAKKYCEYMNGTPCYGEWARYEVVEAA